MEPVRVSIFAKDGNHIVSASRNRDGDYLASTKAPAGEVVITDGIAATDTVIVEGLLRARPGSKVTPRPAGS